MPTGATAQGSESRLETGAGNAASGGVVVLQHGFLVNTRAIRSADMRGSVGGPPLRPRQTRSGHRPDIALQRSGRLGLNETEESRVGV